MANIKYLEQDLLRLDSNDTVIPYSQGTFNISVVGGSGSGDYVWRILPGSGRIVTSNDEVEYRSSAPSATFVYVESGTATLTVYKEGSAISADESYIQSKTLSINLLLTEKDIKIVISPESLTYDFGRGYNISDFTITHPDLSNSEYNNVLSTKPTKYIPYEPTESYDDTFYRFDVFSKASSGGYNNGVQYHRNDNGSWTIKGTPLDSGVSYYNLIVSDSKFPDYLFTNSRYLYRTSVENEPVTTEMVIYFPDSTTTVVDLSVESYTFIKETACGFILRFKVTGQIDSNLEFRLYSLKNRYVDDENTDKVYHVSASGGVVSNSPSVDKKYNKDIQYKSAEFNFAKDTKYPIYNRASTSKCTVTGLKSEYLPKTDIIFTVTAKPNYYFEDGWEDGNICPASDVYNYTTWGRWWVDEDVDICTGVGDSASDSAFFRIRSSQTLFPIIVYGDVPFHRLSAKYDEKGRLIEGTYWIKMPVDSTEILMNLSAIFTNVGSYTWPYNDIAYSDSGTGSENVLYLRDERYSDAMLFCYYAREQYFPDDSSFERLFGSPYDYMSPGQAYYGKFFRTLHITRVHDDSRFIKYVCLGDVIKSLRMISHNIQYNEDSWVLYDDSNNNHAITQNPDGYLQGKSLYSNNPTSLVSEFAGYPPKIEYSRISRSFNIHYPYDYENNAITNTNYNNKVAVKYMDYWYASPADDDPGVATITANSDFTSWARDIPNYNWGAWVGAIIAPPTGVSPNFNPGRSITFAEACGILWRYAKFRQLDILNNLSFEVPDGVSKWFLQQPECRWALSRGLVTGFRAPFDQGNIETVPWGRSAHPNNIVYRFEWAYMLSQFCQQYAW